MNSTQKAKRKIKSSKPKESEKKINAEIKVSLFFQLVFTN